MAKLNQLHHRYLLAAAGRRSCAKFAHDHKRTAPRSFHLPRQTGYTLFELLAVLVIIGLIAGFVMPRFGGSQNKLALKTAAKDLAAVFRYARSRAITQAKPMAVFFSAKDNRLVIAPADEDYATSDAWTNTTEKSFTLPGSLRLTLASKDVDPEKDPSILITFFPIGNATGDTVVVGDPSGKSRYIDIESFTGAVTIRD